MTRRCNHSTRGPRGFSLVYALIALTALGALVSLGVDFGRVALVRSQLQTAADAAAKAAAMKLAMGVPAAIAVAVSSAGENRADGAPIVLLDADVEIGLWDASTRTFTALSGAARSGGSAVRVTTRRTAARGTAVPLLFGSMLGRSTQDVSRVSLAIAPAGYAIVGLNSITMNGNSTDAYRSTTGATAARKGSIASNGAITLGGSSYIDGDVVAGGAVVGAAGRVGGSVRPLDRPLVYPNGDAGSHRTVNDNYHVPLGMRSGNGVHVAAASYTLPGGNYYGDDVTIDASGTVEFTGPAVIYCYGNLTIKGTLKSYNNLPSNLRFVMVPDPWGGPPGSVTFASASATSAAIYAPQSAMTMSGSGQLYGSIVARSVTMSGSSFIHYDLASVSGTSTLVR